MSLLENENWNYLLQGEGIRRTVPKDTPDEWFESITHHLLNNGEHIGEVRTFSKRGVALTEEQTELNHKRAQMAVAAPELLKIVVAFLPYARVFLLPHHPDMKAAADLITELTGEAPDLTPTSAQVILEKLISRSAINFEARSLHHESRANQVTDE